MTSSFFVDRIKLWKTSRYYSLLFALVVLLTFFNNFFFYESVKKVQITNINNSIKALNQYSLSCMTITKGDVEKCLKLTKLYASKNPTDYYGHLILINGIEVIDNRRYKDRDPIKRNGLFPEIEATIEIERNPIPNIWFSVYKSITFSLEDVAEKVYEGEPKEKIMDFVFNTLKGRSQPVLAYFILVMAVGWLMRKSIFAQMEVIDRLEQIDEEELELLEEEFDKD